MSALVVGGTRLHVTHHRPFVVRTWRLAIKGMGIDIVDYYILNGGEFAILHFWTAEDGW